MVYRLAKAVPVGSPRTIYLPDLPLEPSPHSGRMITLFEIRGQYPFMFRLHKQAHALHDFLSGPTTEQQLSPSPNMLIRGELAFILIMEEFSLKHSLKTPLSKVQF